MKPIQYILQYDKKLHDKLKKIYLYNRVAVFVKRLNPKLSKKDRVSNTLIPVSCQKGIISTALEFLNISYDQFLDNVASIREATKTIRSSHDDSKKDSNNYWDQIDISNGKESIDFWKQIDEKWLAMNIYLQLYGYSYCFNSIVKHLPNNKDITACDYGCGSGAFIFALNNKLSFKKLDLYEIDNYVSDYVKFFIDKNSLHNAKWYDILNNSNTEQYDLVNCLDVLEHVENPYQVLEHLTKKVKKGGLLNLQIGFEGDDSTHLPQASQNFFVDNNGLKFLADNYELVNCYSRKSFVSGLYRKK